jgi:hypothetical protein
MNFARKLLSVSALSFLAPLLTSGCLNQNNNEPTIAASNPSADQLSTFNTNMYPINKVVCDPFDPNYPGPNDGLVATLYYKLQNQSPLPAVQDYIDHTQRSNKYLFFSSLNVPTRIFELGFPTETGTKVQNDAGEDLNEYFALSFSSILKLTESDEAGEYQLALLSDDGAVFKIKQSDGTFKTVVNNDGQHPTRLGCGTETIQMNHSSEVAVQLDYYQGPRYHIAMVPMWRKVTATLPPETSCGLTGNETFFDYAHGSTPQPAYQQLLARGWKPIAAGNWHLPASSIFNPCVPGTVPVISNFKLVSSTEGFVVFSWTTDIPATSQLLYKNVASGVETLTEADNVLRTSHQVSVYQGMMIGQTYDFQGISISENYGKSLSPVLRITVQ